MNSQWRACPGYEGIYEVSDTGELRTVMGEIFALFGIAEDARGRGATVYTGKRGYPVANLRRDGCTKSVKVHRLVAGAFVPNPGNLPYVNHKDGNKTNNLVENLEWVSAAENVQHNFRVLGFRGSSFGTKGGTSSKAVAAYNASGELHGAYRSGAEAAEILGVSPASVSACLKGKSRSCAGLRLLNINRLDETRAAEAIAKLRKAIEDREGTTAVAA